MATPLGRQTATGLCVRVVFMHGNNVNINGGSYWIGFRCSLPTGTYDSLPRETSCP